LRSTNKKQLQDLVGVGIPDRACSSGEAEAIVPVTFNADGSMLTVYVSGLHPMDVSDRIDGVYCGVDAKVAEAALAAIEEISKWWVRTRECAADSYLRRRGEELERQKQPTTATS
jgi:hypothetical protein